MTSNGASLTKYILFPVINGSSQIPEVRAPFCSLDTSAASLTLAPVAPGISLKGNVLNLFTPIA